MRTLIHFARALADLGDAGIAHFARAYSLRDAQSGHHELNRLVAALAVLQIASLCFHTESGTARTRYHMKVNHIKAIPM